MHQEPKESVRRAGVFVVCGLLFVVGCPNQDARREDKPIASDTFAERHTKLKKDSRDVTLTECDNRQRTTNNKHDNSRLDQTISCLNARHTVTPALIGRRGPCRCSYPRGHTRSHPEHGR